MTKRTARYFLIILAMSLVQTAPRKVQGRPGDPTVSFRTAGGGHDAPIMPGGSLRNTLNKSLRSP